MANGDVFCGQGGTVTLPQGSSIAVNRAVVERRRLAIANITKPGDNASLGAGEVANTVSKGGLFEYVASIVGTHAENSVNEILTATDGAATLQLGNGETLSGDIVIQDESVTMDWRGGGPNVVRMSFRFTGPVTITQPA